MDVISILYFYKRQTEVQTMSFIIDPPLLLLFGLGIYFLGKKMEWSRHAKIVVGLAIVLIFVIFSVFLYADIIRCPFPFFSQMKGSEFMFHSNITHITKSMVPKIVVLFLFLLYPIWILAGYAYPLLLKKRRRISREVYKYSDVKSKNGAHAKSISNSKNDSNIISDSNSDEPGEATGVYSPQIADKAADSTNSSVYSVKRGEDIRKCVQDAVDSLGGIGRFVKKGDKVLVKINICGGVPDRMGTFTSIKVADVLADLILSAGGKPAFADADMIWTKFWPAAKDSGFVEWAKKKGVDLVNLSETKIVRFDFGQESALGIEKVSQELIDADVIISVPTMKTHLLTGVTLGMKNMYGTFPDIDKAKYHKKSIEHTILEVNSAFTPNLVIIDGSIGGEGIGPLSATPLYYETIIASNDVVLADSIACQLMGYKPLDIVHIKLAWETGLGDATAQFDINSLPYPHPKDGNWERPDPLVKDFFEWGVELILMFPGWETFFDIGADFLMYDTARLPVLRYLVPVFLQLLNDLVYINLKGIKSTAGDITRRVINVSLIGLVALGLAIGYYQDGYIWKSNLLFECSFILAIAIAALASARMKTIHLITLLTLSSLVCYVVENTNIKAGLLQYTGSTDVTIFTISGWILMMAVILQLSDFLTAWLRELEIFKKIKSWKTLPFLGIFAIFILFSYLEGYLAISNNNVRVMYAFMFAIGFLYSSKHSIEWNTSIVVLSVALGCYMELLGSIAGYWIYPFHETLAIFFALSWAVN
ncbi:MAG: hypothetical protein QG646_4406, partial [Euryarchaeota archaeon]|nr:hypothetical protein [Euryarchaeota archaeon]